MIISISKEDMKIKGIAGVEEEESILLSPIEWLYLAKKNLIKIEEKEKEYIKKLEKNIKEEGKEDFYKVYEFLMDKGYVCKITFEDYEYMRVGRKGFRKNEERTKYILRVVKDINKEEVEKDLKISSKMRKKLVYAVVGKEEMKFISIENKLFV